MKKPITALFMLLVPNVDRKMPGTSYFEQAVKFLDAREPADTETN